MRFPGHAVRQARLIAAHFPARRASTASWLGVAPGGQPVVWLVEGYAEMLRRGGAAVPEWAIAVARSDDVLVFRLDRVDRSPATSLELVLAHEIVHQVLQHLGGARLPRWFEEGLCVYVAGAPFLEVDHSIARIAAAGNLPGFAEAERGFLSDQMEAAVSYKVGHSAVTIFLQRFGVTGLRRLLKRVGQGVAFEQGFLDATGTSLDRFERDWRAKVTPDLPFWLFVLVEDIEVTLLCFGGLIVVAGYIRWRLKRERAMQSLGE